ncbi:MAG: NAD(P)H-dependent oxidoreductase subunit E [Deltaproteobacteria bacterium]|nr:NAD(P)H-dependent oxidoreductase subunit E [Deltaproteobacteria bacterium]
MQKILQIVEKWGGRKDCLIEMLHDVQTEYNHLPESALRVLSARLSVPLTQITHVATFYASFSLVPKGDTRLRVCMGTACYQKGGNRILEALERELKVKSGEVTPDGEFSLESARCIGCCGIAPALVVDDDDVFGKVNPTKMKKFVADIKKKKQAGKQSAAEA